MSTFKTLLTDEIDVAGRPAAALADHFETESELVDAFREDVSFTDYSGVGRRTSQKLWDYLEAEYPEADRERKERSDSICTEYTTDHELPDETLEDGSPTGRSSARDARTRTRSRATRRTSKADRSGVRPAGGSRDSRKSRFGSSPRTS